MFGMFIHKWLRIPYTLNVWYIQRPKRPRATVLFIHGLGNTGAAWDDVIKKLPDDIRIVTIDLLGFGESPSPEWAVYDAKTQARSVLATYFKLRITSPVVIVGHSLGALVAIEMAKRYPLLVKSLILCSPPLYDTLEVAKKLDLRRDNLLRQMFILAEKRPENFVKLSAFAMKYKLINKSFNVTHDNVDSYMAALRSMIINQTSYLDAYKLQTPVHILRGTLDPIVVAKNIKQLVKANQNIQASTIIAGHEVRGPYVGAVVKAINQQINPTSKID
jgi:pimeloyl-ACP methyl ester carboxylesterase